MRHLVAGGGTVGVGTAPHCWSKSLLMYMREFDVGFLLFLTCSRLVMNNFVIKATFLHTHLLSKSGREPCRRLYRCFVLVIFEPSRSRLGVMYPP